MARKAAPSAKQHKVGGPSIAEAVRPRGMRGMRLIVEEARPCLYGWHCEPGGDGPCVYASVCADWAPPAVSCALCKYGRVVIRGEKAGSCRCRRTPGVEVEMPEGGYCSAGEWRDYAGPAMQQ